MPKNLATLGQLLHWSYANLAMVDSGLGDGAEKLGQKHFMIRARLFAGLQSGRMQVRNCFDDERLKLTLPRVCWYCGGEERLSLDHIVARDALGSDEADNLIWACRPCNSSKGAKDLLAWLAQKEQFPSVYLLRRYLKLAIKYSRAQELMDLPLEAARDCTPPLPFAVEHVPRKYPPLAELRMFIVSSTASSSGS